MTQAKTPKTTAIPASKGRPESKLSKLIALLRLPEGVDLETMTAATGWQRHSVRGALAGAVRKKGYEVSSDKVEGRRVWRIAEKAA